MAESGIGPDPLNLLVNSSVGMVVFLMDKSNVSEAGCNCAVPSRSFPLALLFCVVTIAGSNLIGFLELLKLK